MSTWLRRPDSIHRGWRYSIVIGPLPEEITPETFAEVKARAAAAIRASRDVVEQTQIGAALEEAADELADADNEEEFNAALTGLYDLGDQYRIIINAHGGTA